MIKVIFGGGLGNQMFQYAFLYANICQQNIREVQAVMHRNSNEDYRNFSLLNFNCSIKMNAQDETEVGLSHKIYLLKRKIVFNAFKKIGTNDNKIIQMMSRVNSVFSPAIYGYYSNIKVGKNSTIEGGFQNWRYFDAFKTQLRKEFVPQKKLSKDQADFLNRIEQTNSVCVHIRRGDYLNPYYASSLAVCDDSYYKRAISTIENSVENPEFFVFTNSHEDHVWIQNNYKFNEAVNYVDLNNPDYMELFLMSRCKHFIISNSTFSWWAQYLSENDNKIVVAPSIWYRNNADSENIYMDNWTVLDVE